MKVAKNVICYLIKVFSIGKSNYEEKHRLFSGEAKKNEELRKEYIHELISSYVPDEEVLSVDWEHLYRNILEEKNRVILQTKVRKMIWHRWAVAASLLLLMGIGYYFLIPTRKEEKKLSVVGEPKTNDIAAPNKINATLTLSNGQKVILDSTGNRTLAMQGSVRIVKLANGQIVYQGSDKEALYNTINNPTGSKVVNLTLADGSKVWLNTASSLRFPTAFTGNERTVEINGEAYFEVAHNSAMPFIVYKGNTSIKVLGTHFNVNAYDDENSLNVTLLEGGVSVKNNNTQRSQVITPGEQAKIGKDGEIKIVKSVDINQVMAWKNGLFSFKDADIEEIMREVSRWYNINVVYENHISERFYADVSRSTNISILLKMLETTKAVQFEIEGNTIIVRR